MRKILFAIIAVITFMTTCFAVSADLDTYILFGDADNNKVVNAADALLVLEITAKKTKMDDSFSIRQNDYDKNYQIDVNDALGILKISAKLEKNRIIEDPEAFLGESKYINGYPENDFFSHCTLVDKACSLEEETSSNIGWRVEIYEYRDGDKQNNIPVVGQISDVGFDKVYWELRWLIEDAKEENTLSKVANDINTFAEEELSDFNGYHYKVSSNAVFLGSVSAEINVLITDVNEMYIYESHRYDFFSPEENGVVFKFRGDVPMNLNVGAVKDFYSTLVNL